MNDLNNNFNTPRISKFEAARKAERLEKVLYVVLIAAIVVVSTVAGFVHDDGTRIVAATVTEAPVLGPNDSMVANVRAEDGTFVGRAPVGDFTNVGDTVEVKVHADGTPAERGHVDVFGFFVAFGLIIGLAFALLRGHVLRAARRLVRQKYEVIDRHTVGISTH